MRHAQTELDGQVLATLRAPTLGGRPAVMNPKADQPPHRPLHHRYRVGTESAGCRRRRFDRLAARGLVERAVAPVPAGRSRAAAANEVLATAVKQRDRAARAQRPNRTAALTGSRRLALARPMYARAASGGHRWASAPYGAALVRALKLDSARHPDRARWAASQHAMTARHRRRLPIPSAVRAPPPQTSLRSRLDRVRVTPPFMVGCHSSSRWGWSAPNDRSGSARARRWPASRCAQRGHPSVPCFVLFPTIALHSRPQFPTLHRHHTVRSEAAAILSGSTSPLRVGCHSFSRCGRTTASVRSGRTSARRLRSIVAAIRRRRAQAGHPRPESARSWGVACHSCPHSRQRHQIFEREH